MQHPSKYVSDSALAARFAVSRNTVWRWAEKGELPKPVKLSPGCTRWNLAEIEAWEAARKSEQQAAA